MRTNSEINQLLDTVKAEIEDHGWTVTETCPDGTAYDSSVASCMDKVLLACEKEIDACGYATKRRGWGLDPRIVAYHDACQAILGKDLTDFQL